MLVVMLTIGSTDVLSALDSIPAVYWLTLACRSSWASSASSWCCTRCTR
jgi:predicted tellurium resistance membrane protein TerC